MVDLEPVVAQRVALIIKVRLGAFAGSVDRLRVDRREMAQQQHRRGRTVQFLVAQRHLRVESVVRLVRREVSAGETLVSAEER